MQRPERFPGIVAHTDNPRTPLGRGYRFSEYLEGGGEVV